MGMILRNQRGIPMVPMLGTIMEVVGGRTTSRITIPIAIPIPTLRRVWKNHPTLTITIATITTRSLITTNIALRNLRINSPPSLPLFFFLPIVDAL